MNRPSSTFSRRWNPPQKSIRFQLLALPQQIAEVEQRSKPLAQVPTRVAVALFLVVVGLLLGPLRDLEPRPRVVRRATRGGGNRDKCAGRCIAKCDRCRRSSSGALLRRPRRRFPQRLSRRPRSQKPFRRIPRKSTWIFQRPRQLGFRFLRRAERFLRESWTRAKPKISI